MLDLSPLAKYRNLKACIESFLPYLESGITELICNTEKELWLYRLDGMREKIKDESFTKDFLIRFAEQLASYRDLFFNHSYPTLNTSIPFTRYRVSVNHFSIAADDQPSLNIRVPSERKFELEEFALRDDKFSYDDLKHIALEGHNMLISGGTGSGKTSFLNALIGYIPRETRVLSIEDSQELDLRAFENHKSLLVGKNEGANFTYENALNMAMRMSPDRLMVGEIDTRNALLFLRFGNTGHKGMVSTLHANSVYQVIEAIALNLRMNRVDMELQVVRDFFKSAIDVVVQIHYDRTTNTRYIQEVVWTSDLDNLKDI
ncbi:CpaF/VirB11 family protein [Helicobacter suis]|uniref:CpaF/VirB11 family protein n=1 Tax=Helicobacter suis TaxID=104628 RepID=UPI0013D7E345|nr:CpaF/VirB11 family protein [Helicobacter suis]